MRATHRVLAPLLFALIAAGCSSSSSTPDSGDAAPDIFMLPDVQPDVQPDIPQDHEPTDCNMHTECGACGAGNGCGWCTNSNRCFDGNELGPDDGSCSGVTWIWSPTYCPGRADFCAMHAACGDCTMQPGCGYCPSMGCTAGTYGGPLVGGMITDCDNWVTNSDDCPASDAGADVPPEASMSGG